MAELTSFTPLTLTQGDIDSLTGAAGPSDDVPNILARDLSAQFTSNPGLSYESLSGGDSPYLKDLGKEFLTDEEIIQFLAMNEDQSDIETGFSRVLTAGGREVAPSLAGIPGMTAGLKAGMALQAPIPPAGPAALAAKALIPITTSIVGGIFGYEAVKAAQDFILGGKEGVTLPEDKTAVLGTKTLVNLGIPISGARVVTKNIGETFDIGGAQYLKNLKDRREEANAARDALLRVKPTGKAGAPLDEALAANRAIPKDKAKMARLNQFIEKAIKQSPEDKISGLERTLIATQAFGGTGGAMIAETVAPDSGLARFAGEMAGSTSFSFFPSLVVTLAKNKSLFGEIFNKVRGTDERNRQRAMQVILKDLESSEDPADNVNKILQLLENPEFSTVLDELGENSPDLTHLKNVVLRTGSPILQGHQINLDNATNAGLGDKTRKESQAFFNTYRDRIIALARTGDPDALQLAANLMEANYTAGLQGRLDMAADEILRSMDQLKDDVPNTETSARLFDSLEVLMRQARATESKMWNSTKNSELSVQELIDSGALRSSDPETPSVLDMLDGFLADYENLPEGIDAEQTKDLGNLLTYARGLRERLTVNTPNVLDDMPASIAKKYEEIQSLGVVTRINSETNRVELAPTDLMGATQTNAQEEAARKKFNDVQEYFNDFDDTPSIADPDATISTQELIKARGTWLSSMRNLSADPTKKNKARVTGNFADLLLDIVEALPFDPDAKAGHQLARAYSKSFNDVFTRAFTGKAVGKARTGELRSPPELLSKKLFEGGQDALAVKLNSFDDMFNFLKANDIDTTYTMADGTILDTVTDSQDLMNRLLSNYALKSFDPETGEINQRTLNKFRENFKTVLDRDEFKSVKEALEDVDSAKQLLATVTAEQAAQEGRLNSLVTFKQLTTNATESPVTTINSAIGGSNKKPMESLSSLLEVVNNPALSPEQQAEAMSGMQHAFLDWAVDKAGGNTLTEGNTIAFKPSKMFEILFTPIPNAKGKQSLITVKAKPSTNKKAPTEFEYGGWLLDNGVMDEGMAERVHTSLIQMVGYQADVEAGSVNSLVSDASAMMDLYLTMIGSAGATKTAETLGLRGGTGNIAIPARGAQMVRDFYNKLPNKNITKVMTAMFEDPDLFALHLRKARDAGEAGTIRNLLGQELRAKVGINMPRVAASALVSDSLDVVESDETEQVLAPAPAPAPAPVPQPVTQLQRPVPPPTMAPAPVAPPTAPSGPVDRSQYAALFPNDMASGLIRASNQGIGSLMT